MQTGDSEAGFNNLLSSTIEQGKHLFEKRSGLEMFQESRAEELRLSQTLSNEQRMKTTSDIIKENAIQDLKSLNYDLGHVKIDYEGEISGSQHNAKESLGNLQNENEDEDSVFNQKVDLSATTFVNPETVNLNKGEDLNRSQWSVTESNIREHNSQHINNVNNRRSIHGQGPLSKNEIDSEAERLDAIHSSSNRQTTYSISTSLRSQLRYDSEQIEFKEGESTVDINPETLLNRYHELRQSSPALDQKTLQFLTSRLNPPRCVVEVLDSLCCLLYGIFNPIEHNYFTIEKKKYTQFKKWLYNLVSLNDVLCHLKLFLETQGIPLRNIEKADERLVIYYKSLRRVENMEYIQTTEEVARYITFFIEYSRILQELEIEPLTQNKNRILLNSSQLLKNHTKSDWRVRIFEGLPLSNSISEDECLELLKNSLPPKTVKLIRGYSSPPSSLLHAVEALYLVFRDIVPQPAHSVKYPWVFYREILRTELPKLIPKLQELLEDGSISSASLQQAEEQIRTFPDSLITKKELNDAFLMQTTTSVLNFVEYAIILRAKIAERV